MAAVPIAINGVIVDYYGRTIMGPVKIVGELVRSDVGIGGGPIIPPEGVPPGGDGKPPGIWGGPIDPYPGHPLPPIIPVPPDSPNVPPPGSPPVIISGTTPTHPITPPSAIIVDYPGIGKVVVPQPTQTGPEPKR